MDLNKHRYYLLQVLLAIFRHPELSQLLAFKGGTSLMLMQGLGEVLMDNQAKNFAREQLIPETASRLELFAACPLIAE